VVAVAAVARAVAPDVRISYVMTDGAALPMALSDLVVDLRTAGCLDATITAGHAFGGDLEAVSVPGALALARHVQHADLVVVGMAPGVVGSGSPLGTTAVEVAGILDAVAALGGDPIAVLRMSSGDPRPRHQGVSHHTSTVLQLTRSTVTVPVPVGTVLDDLVRHRAVAVEPPDVADVLARAGLRITTMGRGPDEDELFFAAAGAAGQLAGQRALDRQER
jgi:uncharacterized protein DUF3866